MSELILPAYLPLRDKQEGEHDGGACPGCEQAVPAYVCHERARRIAAGEPWVRGYNFLTRKVCTGCGFYYLGGE